MKKSIIELRAKDGEQRRIRAEAEGRHADETGKTIDDNPYLSLGSRAHVYAGFWDKGFMEGLSEALLSRLRK